MKDPIAKRHFRGVLATTLVAGTLLIAGTQGASATTISSHATHAKLKSILFVNPLPKYPQWAIIASCLSKQSKALGIPETETGPVGTLNATTMVQEIQQGIADKVGAIVTFPASPAFIPILAQARKAGIITGTMYGGGGSATGQFNTGTDWTALGAEFVAPLAARSGTQNVALLVQAATGVGKAFEDGFVAAAKKTSNVKVEAVGYTNDDPAAAQQQATDILTAHPTVNVFASDMGTATTPVVSVVKAKKLVGKVVMLANGGSGGGIVGAQQHVVYRFLLQNLCGEGDAAATAAAAIAEGTKYVKQYNVQTVLAGLSNYKKYLAKGWD
jgi:ABC-type sugar transport system substrate-binding protein